MEGENVSLPTDKPAEQVVEEKMILTQDMVEIISKNLRMIMPAIKFAIGGKSNGQKLEKIDVGNAIMTVNENGKKIKYVISGEQLSSLIAPIFLMMTGG